MAEVNPVANHWGVFFDRDGTLNHHLTRAGRRGSPWRPEELTLVPDAVPAAEALRRAGAQLFVVTNQPDLDRGLLDPERLDRMHAALTAALGLRKVYVCPHTADRGCRCRKPASGLFHRAATEFGVDLGRSWVVGDRATDAQAGINAGLRALLLTGVAGRRSGVPGLWYATSLTEAARRVILRA